MRAERIDPETLAAFLEGKLESTERERVLRILADHPDEYEVFSDAAHAVTALENRGAGEASATVVPISRGTRRVWKILIPAALAATLGVIVIQGKAGEPLELAGPLLRAGQTGSGSLERGFGPAWDQPGWNVARGPATGLSAEALAFRLGARSLDLELALAAADTTASRRLVAELRSLLEARAGSGAVIALYERLATGPEPPTLDDRRSTAASLRALSGPPEWFDAGLWTESARLALLSGRPELATSSASQKTVDQLFAALETSPTSDPLRGVLLEVRRLVSDETAEMSRLSPLVRELIRIGGQ